MNTAPTIVFFDGACGFCHGWVRRLIACDRAGRLRFAPINGETWKALRVVSATQPDSMVVLDHTGRALTRWRAVICIVSRLGGAARLAAVLCRMIPMTCGNALYDAIARRRRALAAPPLCPLPTVAQRERLLN